MLKKAVLAIENHEKLENFEKKTYLQLLLDSETFIPSNAQVNLLNYLSVLLFFYPLSFKVAKSAHFAQLS